MQTLPLETCCSHAPPPLVQAVAQVQAHQQHQRLHVRTAPPQMVVNASSHSSSMGRNTTAARWISRQRAPPLHGAPHGLTELETGWAGWETLFYCWYNFFDAQAGQRCPWILQLWLCSGHSGLSFQRGRLPDLLRGKTQFNRQEDPLPRQQLHWWDWWASCKGKLFSNTQSQIPNALSQIGNPLPITQLHCLRLRAWRRVQALVQPSVRPPREAKPLEVIPQAAFTWSVAGTGTWWCSRGRVRGAALVPATSTITSSLKRWSLATPSRHPILAQSHCSTRPGGKETATVKTAATTTSSAHTRASRTSWPRATTHTPTWTNPPRSPRSERRGDRTVTGIPCLPETGLTPPPRDGSLQRVSCLSKSGEFLPQRAPTRRGMISKLRQPRL